MRNDIKIIASNFRLDKQAFESFCHDSINLKKFSLENSQGLITCSSSNAQDLVDAFKRSLTERVKIVVVDENTLGYIFPHQPNRCHVLHASILKGSWEQNGSSFYIDKKKVRLANAATDDDEFRTHLSGYKRQSDLYEIN
jgi:hypothetical protein